MDAAQACSSGQPESAGVDNMNKIVIENVAVTMIASDDPIGDNLDLVPAHERGQARQQRAMDGTHSTIRDCGHGWKGVEACAVQRLPQPHFDRGQLGHLEGTVA